MCYTILVQPFEPQVGVLQISIIIIIIYNVYIPSPVSRSTKTQVHLVHLVVDKADADNVTYFVLLSIKLMLIASLISSCCQ